MKNLILGAAAAATLLSCEPIEIQPLNALRMDFTAWASGIYVIEQDTIYDIVRSEQYAIADSVQEYWSADSVSWDLVLYHDSSK